MLPAADNVEIPHSAVSSFSEYRARFFSFPSFPPTLDEVQPAVARFLD